MTDLRSMRRLEPWFCRAPSAHNTQPWLLAYAEDRVELSFDPERHLTVADPTRRDLLLGLGAFVEAVLLTAADAGIALAFEPGLDGEHVGTFLPAAVAYETPYRKEDLERRRTSRLPYEAGRLEASQLEAVRVRLAPAERLHELGANDLIELFVRADRATYDSPAIVAELRAWLRLSRRHPRFAQDGLSYECLALSWPEARGLAALLHPTAYPLVRAVRLQRLLTASATGVLADHGSVLVLDRAGTADEQILESGRSLLRVWLELARTGLYAHPLSQLLDHPASEAALGDRVALEPGHRLLSVFRVGRSATPARSSRLVEST